MTIRSPEQIAAVWSTLEALAVRIGDAETRAGYLSDWRARFDAAFPRWLDDGSIVRLPDWKHVGEISARERRQAKMVSEAWLETVAIDASEPDACKRFAWELGRRCAAGFLEQVPAQALLTERLGSGATMKAVPDAFRRGQRGDAGEALLAAIVLDLRCAVLPRTDLGNAKRFRLRHGHDFRHTTAKGWLKWDGMRWKVLEEERGLVPAEILAAVFDTVLAIQREADAIRATGLSEASVPEGVDPTKFKVEVDGAKVPVGELLLDRYGDPRDAREMDDALDTLVVTASTCRLMSEALGRYGRASEDAKKIKCIADLARPELTVRIQDFDTDPFTINCQNGTLRLLRHVDGGEVTVDAVLSPHCREDLLTKVAAVAYDPDATCPHYDGTIDWAQPKPEMRRYLHQWGGYNLTGAMGEQIFHVWWGPLAQNGKSTILDAWAECAGDYADGGKIETFMEAANARGGDAATPALAKLPGVRMLRVGEPPANAKFDESLINTITGQDPLPIRDNFRSFFTVKLQFKLTVACNQPPSIPNATEGIRRRVKVVPFEKTMKGALKPDGTPLRDPKFAEKIVPEYPGVLRRLIEGAMDWMKHGFVEPGDVTAWTEEYKDDNDPLGRFLDYCTLSDPEARTQSSKLFQLFEAWSKATGGPTWSQTGFSGKMKKKGFSSKASNGMQWLGIRTTREVRDFVDEHGNVVDLSGDGGAGEARGAAPPGDPPPSSPHDDPDWMPEDW